MPCTISGLIITPQSCPHTYRCSTGCAMSGSIWPVPHAPRRSSTDTCGPAVSGRQPPPVGTSQTNFSCSPGSTPGGHAGGTAGARCSTSCVQVSRLPGSAADRGVAVRVLTARLRAAEIVRRDRDQRGADIFGRARRGPAQHDRHAAADRAVGGQRHERIGMHTRIAVGIALQHLADHGGHQRLVCLARGRGAHHAGDGAVKIDAHQARIHPRRRVVLRIEERLESRVAARRLQAGRDADAGEAPLRAQRVTPATQRRVGAAESALSSTAS